MQRNHFIDALKGILILFVLLMHYPTSYSGIVLEILFGFVIQFAVPAFMFLSGYVQAKSMQRRKIQSFEDAYACPLITGKILRFLLPYAFFFLLAQVFYRLVRMYTIGVFEYGVLALFFDFLKGGYGPGSYYVPLLFQLIFLFPLVYAIIEKKGKHGLFLCLMANIAFEVLKQAFGMQESEYRLLIFRYLFLIACGCYMAIYENEKSKENSFPPITWIICLLAGIMFLILFRFTNYPAHAKIITMWGTTSVLTSFYVVPILCFLVKRDHFSIPPLEVLGKYSFHVFLVQTLYYQYYDFALKERFTPGIGLIVTICICVILGVVFGAVEERLGLREKILSAIFGKKKQE
jgi:fucose 4-O-acetylase-like acetyltransferase